MNKQSFTLKNCLKVCFLLMLSGESLAGTASGAITLISIQAPSTVFFTTSTHVGKPACSTAGNDWALSLATDAGKAQYTMLLSAAAQGKAINVQGDNTCTAWSDRETPQQIFLTY